MLRIRSLVKDSWGRGGKGGGLLTKTMKQLSLDILTKMPIIYKHNNKGANMLSNLAYSVPFLSVLLFKTLTRGVKGNPLHAIVLSELLPLSLVSHFDVSFCVCPIPSSCSLTVSGIKSLIKSGEM